MSGLLWRIPTSAINLYAALADSAAGGAVLGNANVKMNVKAIAKMSVKTIAEIRRAADEKGLLKAEIGEVLPFWDHCRKLWEDSDFRD